MNHAFDLDAYLERIGYGRPIRADQECLGGLLRGHMTSIPFENLDVLLGRPIRLDLASIQAKLVGARRGGYCFEHANLFAAALEGCGFEPRRHSARVVMVAPLAEAPRTHMFLTVAIDGRRMVLDPGFGALAPRAPLPLVAGAEVRVGDEAYWLERDGGCWLLHTRSPRRTMTAWVSTLEDEQPVDFVMGNHYTSTFPGSPFVNRLMLRALTDDGQIAVMNRELSVRRGSEVETRQLADRTELRALLARSFGFDLPEVERMRVPSIAEWQ